MKRHLLIILLLLISVGCASPPPAGYDTKRGTQRPYRIDGKWYTPVNSSYGFEQSGIASWYGSDFHGRPTANGETFDMHSMTAAHKTLPMGTYVSVRRRDNGKETIVRINDRGPFVSGRIIDLSYKAAITLGMEDEGTAPVIIVALGDTVGDRLVKKDYDRGDFSIQVGAFTLKDNAYNLERRLKKLYGSVAVMRFEKDGQNFYRVRIVNVNRLKEAEKISRRLASQGLPASYVVAD